MSRGNRGGGGWRGGRPRPGTKRIGGVDLAYEAELDRHLQDRPKPAPLFPKRAIAPQRPLSQEEKAEVAEFCALRNRIRDGPLYATLGSKAGVSKSTRLNRKSSIGEGKKVISTQVDPFDGGVQTYSQRYIKKSQRLPRLDTHSHVLHFYPQELWSALEPRRRAANITGTGSLPKAKRSLVASGTEAQEGVTRNEKRELLEHGGEEDEDGAAAKPNADEDGLEEEIDDQYTSDEDEMAGDYNAEQYFDDGGDDAGEDYYDGVDADGGDY